MSQIQTLIQGNNKYSQEAKDFFMKVWNLLKDEKKQQLEKDFEAKPELLDKMLESIDMKNKAMTSGDSSQIDNILKLEEEILESLGE